MDNNQRDQSQKEMLERAGAFEEMIRTKGWEWVLAIYQAKVQTFTTNILMSDQPIENFEAERQQIMGIKGLLADVTSDLDGLARFRKEASERQKIGTTTE